MKIKATPRFHLTLGRVDIIKKTNNKMWQECGGKATIEPLWKSVWRFQKKKKNLINPNII
jgi:hypothetical protein